MRFIYIENYKFFTRAERSALFLIDNTKKELVAEIFDQPSKSNKEIRFISRVAIYSIFIIFLKYIKSMMI